MQCCGFFSVSPWQTSHPLYSSLSIPFSSPFPSPLLLLPLVLTPHIALRQVLGTKGQLYPYLHQIVLKALYMLSFCYNQGHSWSGKVQNSHQCILQRSNGIYILCCSRKFPDTQQKDFWVKPSCYTGKISKLP